MVLEGYLSMLEEHTRPYQIPFGIMIPVRVDALLVPVAASTTHVAFSTIRMEPCWMVMGQAAGVAAALAVQGGVSPREVSIDALQRLLLEQGQILTYFVDLDEAGDDMPAIQYFGTRGFFNDYVSRPHAAVSRTTAATWLRLALRCIDNENWPANIEFGLEDDRTNSPLTPRSASELLASAASWCRRQPDTRLARHGEVIATFLSNASNWQADSRGDSKLSRGQYCTILYRLLEQLHSEERASARRLPATVGGPHWRPMRTHARARGGSGAR
jgi:hypothetical protein